VKKLLALTLLCSLQLAAMDKAEAKLNFSVAQKGEDLSAYKAVLLKIYPEFAKDEAGKEAIKKLCEVRFAVILSWLGKEQHRFIKVQDGQQPVGFLTLEALDKEKTRIGIHHSPLLPAYLAKAKEFLAEQVKVQFPHAKTMYSSASGAAPKLQELVKSLGFEQDDTYKPNSELNPDSTGFVGFRKNI
jgi:hypothetical protein